MKLKHRLIFAFLSFLAIALFAILYSYSIDSAVLAPKGLIAIEQRSLIYVTTLLMLIVVIPVLLLTFVISYRYRASNKEAEYEPNWSHDAMAEAIWWGFPYLIIVVLSIVTWKSSRELDPYKPLDTSVKPVVVQVVALQWKWLFIYPEYKIASINLFQFPEQTPLRFEITADAPMNSFWIPELGGQIYAMPGMIAKLNLIAEQVGDFRGVSANLSGTGFAGMAFTAKSTSEESFETWVKAAKASKKILNTEIYKELAKPSENNPVEIFRLEGEDLFNYIVMSYMMPPEKMNE